MVKWPSSGSVCKDHCLPSSEAWVMLEGTRNSEAVNMILCLPRVQSLLTWTGALSHSTSWLWPIHLQDKVYFWPFLLSQWSMPSRDRVTALFSFWRGALLLSHSAEPQVLPELVFWDPIVVLQRFFTAPSVHPPLKNITSRQGSWNHHYLFILRNTMIRDEISLK